MRGMQLAIDQFIRRFQARWENEAKFRAAWSTIGSALTLIALCSCMFLVSRVGGTLIFGTSNATNANSQQGPLKNFVPTYAVPTTGPGNGAPPTAGIPVASSAAPTPTPTVPPTLLPFQPTVAPTAGTTQAFTTAPQAGPWIANQLATILNITSTPALPNATITIDIDFRGSCKLSPSLSTPLDGSGTAYSVTFTVPACAKAGNATVTISGTGFPPYTIPTPFNVG